MTSVPFTNHLSTPTSVAIKGIWYDEVTSNLYLQFKNGTFAGYTGVPRDVFDGFNNTDSVGRFYNREFARKNFTGATLPQAPVMEERKTSTVQEQPYRVMVMVTIPHADSPGSAVNVLADAVKAAGLKIDKVRAEVVE